MGTFSRPRRFDRAPRPVATDNIIHLPWVAGVRHGEPGNVVLYVLIADASRLASNDDAEFHLVVEFFGLQWKDDVVVGAAQARRRLGEQHRFARPDHFAQHQFSGDEYIRRHHARSILCLPLLKEARLVGVLYLENNLALDVFTPDRIVVLKLLASEAAISLENIRLYADLQDREAKIRRLVDSNIIGMFMWC
jgi:GAF domain-containing protein